MLLCDDGSENFLYTLLFDEPYQPPISGQNLVYTTSHCPKAALFFAEYLISELSQVKDAMI